eukprot:CAMPEP_0172503868 /NCGR_PEP_ID=MMETSP1066-20121228/173163_1 /TAXON_ID=671091 /ORGANISM="Coscinodiscus wailesii, Strain CCMP2513" /LENGTH=48 /DNA_ID= /DNA_START= /DNA_END= /DNA_ORIENTATION=
MKKGKPYKLSDEKIDALESIGYQFEKPIVATANAIAKRDFNRHQQLNW